MAEKSGTENAYLILDEKGNVRDLAPPLIKLAQKLEAGSKRTLSPEISAGIVTGFFLAVGGGVGAGMTQDPGLSAPLVALETWFTIKTSGSLARMISQGKGIPISSDIGPALAKILRQIHNLGTKA